MSRCSRRLSSILLMISEAVVPLGVQLCYGSYSSLNDVLDGCPSWQYFLKWANSKKGPSQAELFNILPAGYSLGKHRRGGVMKPTGSAAIHHTADKIRILCYYECSDHKMSTVTLAAAVSRWHLSSISVLEDWSRTCLLYPPNYTELDGRTGAINMCRKLVWKQTVQFSTQHFEL